jgi:DNA-binding transcriptional MerR regulator
VEHDIVQEVKKALESVPNKSYYRIGEVAKITGIKPYVLRYWETEFRPVVPPKSKSGQRMYRQREIAAVLLVKKLLYKQRFTIAGARRRLSELLRERKTEAKGATASAPVDSESFRHIRRDLEQIRNVLSEA